MPYTASNPPRVAKHWSEPEKRVCSSAANSALKKGKSEQDAVFACIGAVKRHRNRYKTYKQEPEKDKFDKLSEEASLDFQHLVELWYAGELTLSEFTDQFRSRIDELYIQVMSLGRGTQEVTERDLQELQRRVQEQYSYLDGLVQDLQTGRYSQRRATWRAGMYGIPYGAFIYYNTPPDVYDLMPVLPGYSCLGQGACGCVLDVSYDEDGTAYVDWILDPVKEHCVICLEAASETFVFTAEELVSGHRK